VDASPLPADHPVWTVREAAAPIDDGNRVVAMPGPGWLHATRHDGLVRIVNHGSDRARHLPAYGLEDPHYTRFGYASHAAPEAGKDARVRAVDGHVAVVAQDGAISRRRSIEPIAVHDRFAASAYEDELPAGPVRVDGVASVILALHGFHDAAVARAVDANAFGACSATPCLTAPDHPGGTAVYVSLVVLTGDRVDPGVVHASVHVAVDGDRVTVGFPDGERVELAVGSYVRHPVDGGTPVRWLDSG
jgi:hypothetical protein